MPHPAKAVANEFVELANDHGKFVTPMKLLKLVYFAHGWHLALADAPLLDENVEAWKFGPVVPSVYHAFKDFGMNPIEGLAKSIDLLEWKKNRKLRFFNPRISSEEYAMAIIRRIWEVYGKLSAIALSNLTHQPGTPWSVIWEEKGKYIKGTDIPDSLIRQHFLQKLAKANA